jgi:hypothetical protein
MIFACGAADSGDAAMDVRIAREERMRMGVWMILWV